MSWHGGFKSVSLHALSLTKMFGMLTSMRTLMSVCCLCSRTKPGNFRPQKRNVLGYLNKSFGLCYGSPQIQLPVCSVDDANHWGPDSMGDVTSPFNGRRNKDIHGQQQKCNSIRRCVLHVLSRSSMSLLIKCWRRDSWVTFLSSGRIWHVLFWSVTHVESTISSSEFTSK